MRTDSKKITQEYLMQRAWKPGLWRENQICRTQSLKTMSQNGEGNDGADSSFDEKLKPWIYFCWRSQGKLKFTGGRRGRERYILRSSNVKISQKKTFGLRWDSIMLWTYIFNRGKGFQNLENTREKNFWVGTLWWERSRRRDDQRKMSWDNGIRCFTHLKYA